MLEEVSTALEPSADLAAMVQARRVDILANFERTLDAMRGGFDDDPVARRHVVANADQMLTDVVQSLRIGRVSVDGDSLLVEAGGVEPGGTECARSTRSTTHPREWLVAGAVLSDIVLRAMADDLEEFEHPHRRLALATRALQHSLTTRLDSWFVMYAGQLLDGVREAQATERRRIARELHDRVGCWLHVAYRQLELSEMTADGAGTDDAQRRREVARGAVKEAMHALRGVTSGLRLHETMRSLNTALQAALQALEGPDLTVTLSVNGDEAWASHTVKDEIFLIVLEAVRNAVRHGAPTLVAVSLDIAPHELRVLVHDDGTWLDCDQADGIGLSTMRERAELIDGVLTVFTAPGPGTRVELVVPLGGP